MIKITDLRIDPSSLGSTLILADITPAYEYKNGEKTPNINAYKYSVVLPDLKYEKIAIKVSVDKKPTPLFDVISENHKPVPTGIQLGFKGLTVGTYFSNGSINVTANADDVFLIDNKKG